VCPTSALNVVLLALVDQRAKQRSRTTGEPLVDTDHRSVVLLDLLLACRDARDERFIVGALNHFYSFEWSFARS
jgi:hypothetical protein